ncbi:hypothetical protein CRENBAI_000937 [Crenichthys baileyi]|uniref:Uncharacterized protein n=1 Tax=Crenichthys baileyi TaxID=28760 RepID=A0AAV9R1Y3_9TELE
MTSGNNDMVGRFSTQLLARSRSERMGCIYTVQGLCAAVLPLSSFSWSGTRSLTLWLCKMLFTSPPFCQPKGSSRSRGAKSAGKLSVSETPTSWGVEAPSRGGGDNLEEVQQCSCGPVCLPRDDILPALVLSGRQCQSPGLGCVGTCAALHFPPLPLIGEKLLRVLQEGHWLLLMALIWPCGTWFPLMHSALLQLFNASPPQEGPPGPTLGLAVTGPRGTFSEYGREIGRTMSSTRSPSI